MTRSTFKTLSHELHALADDATDHLKDAVKKTGSEASDAMERSVHAIRTGADRLRDGAQDSMTDARAQAIAATRAHPLSVTLLGSIVIAALVTLATMRLSQS